jgi:hypothetical protein
VFRYVIGATVRESLRALISLLRRVPDDGTCEVPKHAGALLTFDVYVLVRVMLVTKIDEFVFDSDVRNVTVSFHQRC